jgi:hypothetical protein
MKKPVLLLITVCLLVLCISNFASNQSELKMWKEFLIALMNDQMTLDKIRPFNDAWKETILGWLKQIKEYASPEELKAEPETFRVDNKVHFIIPLTFGESSRDYCFSFLIEGNDWYFHGLEGILIRLDKISSLPTTKFPDMPEDWKATHREETKVTKQVRLFNFISEEKGKDFALNWFKDGYGYFLAAQVRVPFFTPSKAFILYLCWEQANLIGNTVKLVKLDEKEAIVEIQSKYFHLYKAAAHLKEQISFEDYQKIFESIWYDRAEKAGWKLEIRYRGEECHFQFTK